MATPTITYVLFLLIGADPYPTVSMIQEFATRQECHQFIIDLKAPPESKERLVCQGVVVDDMTQPASAKPSRKMGEAKQS